MNSKNIKRHLNNKIADWVKSVDNEEVARAIEENVIVTGGSIVSLLTGEEPHDYDIYFRTKEALEKVCKYYADLWNKKPDKKGSVSVVVDGEDRVKMWVQSSGVAEEKEKTDEPERNNKGDKKSPYRPTFFTSNAITLSDKIQIVTRFYGEVEEIHKNYDFAHCTCSWCSWDNELNLPVKALECIINKELHYIGSKYPLCSIIRTRKFINRGYHINAGQYVKMAMQLNELDLTDIEVLKDQLTGVDSAYFEVMIDALNEQKEKNEDFRFDSSYVIELINRIF